ncbi:MAG TPA: hypothetical protein VEK15_15320 [Vicinamibacteria bacterium]|nr:hypothetical protein [Vicinamibacteria bacterium]
MKGLGIGLLFVLLTGLFTYPLSVRPGEEALDLGPDTRLFLWTLAWDIEALTTRPLSIFDANIFYPEPRTLAYSEHQLGSALLAAPVMLASGQLLLSMNVVLLLSCLGSGLAGFYLGRTLGLGTGGALVTGIVFALAPPRFFRLGQLHLATVQWVPLCLAMLHRYASHGRLVHLLGAVLAFTLQALSGGQTALFLALAATGLLVHLTLAGKLRPESPRHRDAAIALTLLAVLNVPFVVPYLQVKKELGLERTLAEAREWSPNAASFAASPTHLDRLVLRTFGWERPILRDAKAYLFPGLFPLVLAGIGSLRKPPSGSRRLLVIDGLIVASAVTALALELLSGVRFALGGFRFSASGGGRAAIVLAALVAFRIVRFGRRPFTLVSLDYYTLLAVLSLWVSLGPDAGLYSLLHRLVPGFDLVRVPSRATLLTVLALAVLAGRGYRKLRLGSPRIAALVLGLVLLELAAFPLGTTPYAIPTSSMDRWLAEQPEQGAVAVFPVPDPRDEVESARRHSAYMLQSIAHFRPLVNGYSGFLPEGHSRLFRLLVDFPNEEGLTALEGMAVRFAVFHRDAYGASEWRKLEDSLRRFSRRLEPKGSFEDGLVYELVSRDRRDR